MTTPPVTESWVRNAGLGDLYVLHLDGKETAATSLVDRSLLRADQINALAQVAWPPPQQLTAVYNAIVQAQTIQYFHGTLPDGRKLSPLLGGHGATIDGDEEPSTHPLRRYLFPDLERSGELALDLGETIVAWWRSFRPKIAAYRAKDGAKTGSATHVPNELREPVCVLTNQRLACFGRLHFPTAVREDYPSIFLPPVLFDSIAAFRQIKRWSARPNLYWGIHIRHEWVSQFGFGNRPEHKRPFLMKKMDDTMFVTVRFRYASGSEAAIRLSYRQPEPGLSQIGDLYSQAVRWAQPQAVLSEPVEAIHQVTAGVLANKTEPEATTSWTVEGTVPWSLPASLPVAGQ